MSWVGRPLPRYEDPALLQGRGRYTADLALGARAMRFVRNPVARGRILGLKAPPGATVIAAADLADVKPICARLDDLAEQVEVEIAAETPVTGAKGVGEGGTIGAPAAVLNAIFDALAPLGIGIYEMPITPQRIRQCLRDSKSSPQ
jgi:CO/xanthine dehydrogenase Mo-binding subunit